MTSSHPTLVPPLAMYVGDLLAARVPSSRLKHLQQTAAYVSDCLASGKTADLVFICTHNSRRSHLAHVWADTAARYLRIEGVRCFSGGVEVTECNERTVRAMRRAGFSVVRTDWSAATNPRYQVQAFEALPPLDCHSKIYSTGNPEVTEFAALMCCSDVDETCPFVPGAEIRVPLHYDDPKSADGTRDELTRYDERCREIANEMFQLMHFVGA